MQKGELPGWEARLKAEMRMIALHRCMVSIVHILWYSVRNIRQLFPTATIAAIVSPETRNRTKGAAAPTAVIVNAS